MTNRMEFLYITRETRETMEKNWEMYKEYDTNTDDDIKVAFESRFASASTHGAGLLGRGMQN